MEALLIILGVSVLDTWLAACVASVLVLLFPPNRLVKQSAGEERLPGYFIREPT